MVTLWEHGQLYLVLWQVRESNPVKWKLTEGKDTDMAKETFDEKEEGENWVSNSDGLGHPGKRRSKRRKNITKIEILLRLGK